MKVRAFLASIIAISLLSSIIGGAPTLSNSTGSLPDSKKQWRGPLTLTRSHEALATVVFLLDRYARNVAGKNEFDRAVEKAMSQNGRGREIAARWVRNFQTIPFDERQKVFGKFAEPTKQEMPASQIRDTITQALKSAKPERVDKQTVPDPVKPAKPTEKDLKSEGKAEPPAAPEEDVQQSNHRRRGFARPDEPLQLRYVGLYCREEADYDQGTNSDEIFLITEVVDVARAMPEGDPISHPFGRREYEDVDSGETRNGPVVSVYTGPPKDLTMIVTMWERDRGDPNYYRDEVERVTDVVLAIVGAAVGSIGGPLGAIVGAAIGAGIGELLTDAINGLLDTGDDLIEATSVFLSTADLANMYRSEVHDRRGIRYHFSTRHNENEGANYFALFFVEDPNSHITVSGPPAAEAPRLPADLVVASFRATGPAVRTSAGIEIPVRVEVMNRGAGAAPIFKVEVQYSTAADFMQGTFIVPGQETSAYAFTRMELRASASAAFIGRVVIPPSVRATKISLRALADSCASDEFLPAYCRVRETDETNNFSAAFSVAAPR